MPPPKSVVRVADATSLSSDDCRLLVQSAVDYAIFMLDPEGRVLTWNPGAEKIKGYAASEIVGQHFSKFYTDEDLALGKPQRELAAALEDGRVEDEGWRIRKDGGRFWANVVITALRDETGKLRGFGKVTRDLTAHRAAEAQLRHAEQRFHHLVDAVIDYAIFMLDETGRVATWNSGAHRLKGYTADEIVGQHFSKFYTAEDRAAMRPDRILDKVRRDGRHEDESWRVRKDGTKFWANVVITPLVDNADRIVGFAKVTRDLTDRRRAEEDLRRSEERFRLLVENVVDYAIYVIDAEGRVTTWNRGAERMKGYSADEIIGSHFARFFPAEDVVAGKPARELAFAVAQGRHEDEGWRVRKDGSRFWANAILTALRDGTGKLVGYAKITRDLTLRREADAKERALAQEQAAREVAEGAERQIRESEERYRAISQRLEIVLEGVADGITVQDRSGRVVFANSAAARICGFETGDELMNAAPADVTARFDVFDEEGLAFALENLPGRRVLAGETFAVARMRVRHRQSRHEWWTLVRANAVVAVDGTHELAVNIWHDVTEQHRQDTQSKYLAEATAALGASLDVQQMLSNLARVLVPGLGDWCAIYLLDDDRDLRAVAVAHSSPERVAEAEAYQRKFEPDPAQPRGVWNVLRTGAPELYNHISEEMLVRAARDPEHLALLRSVGMKSVLLVPITMRSRVLGVLSLVSSDSGKRYEASDVTLIEELARRAGVAVENARLYATAHAAAKAAEDASRAKDEFLATVSHELRTPLNAILGWSAILKDKLRDTSVAKPMEAIHRNAQAQVKIVDDILDVARVITGKFRLEPKPADIVSIARDALDVVSASAVAKKVDVEFVPRVESIFLVADPERLQQVIWNLLSNALKFTDTGGRVRVLLAQEGAHAVVTVEDTGKGMDAAFLPYAFDRFKQADASITRRIGGLGLGLALVRHIVELHGGRVEASSPGIGKGSAFTVILPIRAVAPEPAAPAASVSPTRPTLTGIRVLVVDDEADARDLVSAVLTEAGAVVEAARSASEGFEAFARFRPNVLISDIGMPDEDGFSLIRRIRALPAAEGGHVPSLALTAFAREEDWARALNSGYTTHVGKPVNPDALVSAVANVSAVFRPR